MGCISIQVPAQPVSFNGDIPRASDPGAFEDSVLDKVANAVYFGRFVTRPPANPDPGRHGAEPGHVFGQDGYTVREFRGFNFVYHSVGDQRHQIYTAVEKGSSNPSTP